MKIIGFFHLNKHRRIKTLLLLSLITTLLPWSSLACSGETSYKINFENQSEYELTVFINNYKLGNVLPGKQITDSGIPMNLVRLNIEARTLKGETIFSKTLSRDDMEKINNVEFKVVIKANNDLPPK